MKNSKKTRRALICSLLSLVVCVSMLVGSTYAWFTDTASAGVNTIQSGTLDVALVNEAGESLEGETLAFKTADNRDTAILWEPGCTYELDPVYVKNNGNLAFKYKIVVNGIDGNAKLLEAIEWTVNIGATLGADLSNFEGHLTPANALSDAIVISGHMKEEAGNEYQNLTLNGIGITIYATQDTVEYDSFNNTYDADAAYPVVVKDGAASFSSSSAPVENKSTTVSITNIDAANGDTVVLNVNTGDLEEAQSTFAVEENHTAIAGIDLSLTDNSGQKVTFDEGLATVTTYILPGLDAANLTVKYDGEGAQPTLVSYNSETGELVFTTTHFSSYYADYNGTFAYVAPLNRAFTGFDCGSDAIDAITIYAENSLEDLDDILDVEAMTEFYCEEAFPADAHTVIKTALIGGCQGFRPSSVESWVLDFVKNGATTADVVALAQDYFDSFKAGLDATEFYPREEGSIYGWAPWPMGMSFGEW